MWLIIVFLCGLFAGNDASCHWQCINRGLCTAKCTPICKVSCTIQCAHGTSSCLSSLRSHYSCNETMDPAGYCPICEVTVDPIIDCVEDPDAGPCEPLCEEPMCSWVCGPDDCEEPDCKWICDAPGCGCLPSASNDYCSSSSHDTMPLMSTLLMSALLLIY